MGYDAVLVSDATASGIERHYDSTLERIRDYYGIVVDLDNLKKMLKTFEQINDGYIKYDSESNERIIAFLEKHNLIDLGKVARDLKRLQGKVYPLLSSNMCDLNHYQLISLLVHLIALGNTELFQHGEYLLIKKNMSIK